MKRFISRFQVRYPKWGFSWLLILLDSVVGYFAYIFSLETFITKLGVHPIWGFVCLQLMITLIFSLRMHFLGSFTVSRAHELKEIAQTTLSLVFFFIIINAVFYPVPWIPAERLIEYWFQFYIGVFIVHLLIRGFQKSLLSVGVGQEKTIILGVNPRGLLAAQILSEHQQQGYNIIGFVKMTDDTDCNDELQFPILGEEAELNEIIVKYKITEVLFALEENEHDRLLLLLNQLNGLPVNTNIIPALQDAMTGLIHTEQLQGLPLLALRSQLNSRYLRYYKRLTDLLYSVVLIILSLPITLVSMVLIKIDSRGPIFYIQERVGKDEVPFPCYKFRSMREDAEKHTGPVWSEDDDPRITNIGNYLRKFRIDEIPQLINVIKGEMSLIGPRPERPYFVEKLKKEIPLYSRRFKVRPGISGWAQIKQRSDRELDDVREKLRYDFYYLENISFNIDLKIILSTILVMFSGKGR